MKLDWQMKLCAGLIAMGAAVAAPSSADAFCGFYVGGAGAELYNDATQVVLMRDGTKTVLSMQNRYEGPLEDFAMVVPVPQVLMEDNVKTLEKAIFDKVDTLTSPRLVEYWEQDPCNPYWGEDELDSAAGGANNSPSPQDDGGVTVEAQFKVGEYEIVILSTEDSTALDSWLSTNNYNTPAGAAAYYEPYVQGDMYFFVAKVDPNEVKYENGRAILSPLRFHYDSDEFALPVRLGMINSAGKQDLLVYTLGKGQRYEVANYPNVTIPTNIEVVDDVRNDFGSFYTTLYDRTMAENPGAAVTEYSWQAGSCDPCPGPVTLQPEDLETLGEDIIPGEDYWEWTITRLHMQYQKDDIGEDLIFKEADPIVGGREFVTEDGKLETGARAAEFGGNAFQARYIIRHRWEGPVECDEPQYEIWGGDPESADPWGGPAVSPNPSPNTSGDKAFADGSTTNAPIEALVEDDIPEINVIAGEVPPGSVPPKDSVGCSSASAGSTLGGTGLLLLGMFGWRRRRRRRS